MRLVASTPDSKPVPEAIRSSLAAISQDDLREVVERISVPRPTGTPENEAVRRSIIELFCCTEAGRLGVELDEAGNVVVGDPRRAKILIGAALRLDPRHAGGRRQRQRRVRPHRHCPSDRRSTSPLFSSQATQLARCSSDNMPTSSFFTGSLFSSVFNRYGIIPFLVNLNLRLTLILPRSLVTMLIILPCVD